MYALLRVGGDETEQVARVGAQVLGHLYELAPVVNGRVLHPGRRGPGRGEEAQLRRECQGALNIGYEREPVALYGEVL